MTTPVGARAAPAVTRSPIATSTATSAVVTNSYGRGHLTPRDNDRQRRISFDLDIDPSPADLATSRDAFGNISSYFQVTDATTP